MSVFSQYTVIEALELISNYSHDQIDRLLIRFRLEAAVASSDSSKSTRVNQLIQYLLANPDAKGPFGANLTFEIIEYLIDKLVESLDRTSSREVPPGVVRLVRALAQDGYIIDGRALKPMIPSPRGPVVTQSELLDLLNRFGFATSRGHLEQAVAAHSRGEWASANAQLRSFIESLFDEIASKLDGAAAASAATSEERRRLLATISPPFLLGTLNEWDLTKGNGFVQGFWRRLHPQGSHPGLSDEEDSTFRLHLVQVVAHNLMKRLAARPSLRGRT
ncbi:MAG: hypothetical protein QOF89_171 [Acidobacteriota bacterium]|jgi:hypothetical protein|nr:hypothetical protein [Acidobacteriota bacterium]